MLLHYLTIAYRNLWKYRFYSGLNLIGLAIGMASCLLILIHVRSELSFDQFHEQPEEIYRVAMHASVQGSETNYPMIGSLWGDLLGSEVQGVKAWMRMFGGRPAISFLTVSYLSYKAAIANPADSLYRE